MRDLVVVGGGPAGLAAARTAARSGADVLLVDASARLGGQIWRQPASGALPEPMRSVLAHPRIEVRAGTTVWRAAPRSGSGAVLSLSDRTQVEARTVVLATGASELVLPFPGWDLPGVVTPGAAQALLKAHGVPIGRRVVVAGTGPFLWPVAAALHGAGVRVAALVEAAPLTRLVAVAAGLARHPRLVAQTASYLRSILAARIPVLSGRAVVAAHGVDAVRSVTVAANDGSGRREIPVDAVCVGWGFVPSVELARALGCHETPHPFRPLCTVDVDAHQATTVPGVFAAGEPTGVGGVVVASAEGTIAGAGVARWLGAGSADVAAARTTLRRARRAAALLDRGFPLPMSWPGWLTPETMVCRCEEVTWAQVADAVDAGITDVRAIKGQVRCGMGWCQGRVCGPAIQSAVAIRADRHVHRVGDLATRPFAAPVPLRDLSG
ncbi:MAG: NAD(P)/FAD-dependent oxidoreductase [Actinomycetota bacterium]